jgi:flagellar basal-body rod modification protein FlgD
MITGITAAASALTSSGSSVAQKKSNLDYDSFLKLLVTQMKNQDPTKPMDSTEYIAQLATFSNVEQSINANKKLDELIQETKITQAIGLIGRQVTSLDGLGYGTVETVRFAKNGVVATLSDGSELLINERVTIGLNEPG